MAILKQFANEGETLKTAVRKLRVQLEHEKRESGILVFDNVDVTVYVKSDVRDIVEKYEYLKARKFA